MSNDYLTELAEHTFKKIESGERDEMVWPSNQPLDTATLVNHLNSRPDLQARAASLTGYTPSKWLLEQELPAIDLRRKRLGIEVLTPDKDLYARAANSGVMGLCFSGGGIRSATFNLGILQGLAELKLLHCFDYLSTVSGGGYIHQWFAAWSKRCGFEEVDKQLIPLPDPDNPGIHPEPIRWLRRYSNYLTPQKGLLSGDTWVAFAIWLRNTLLNQIVLISGLMFLILLPHLLEKVPILSRSDGAVSIVAAVIIALNLMAIYFVGLELLTFAPKVEPAPGSGSQPNALGQVGVHLTIVLPLVVSAALFTLIFPYISSPTLGIDLLLLMFGLALTITFAGGAPLAYLKTHVRTSQHNSVSEFWKVPKCWAHLKFILVVMGQIGACILATAGGAAWVVGSLYFLIQGLSSTGFLTVDVSGNSSLLWRIVLVVAPLLILGGPLVMMLLLIGFLGRTFRNSHREWLSRMAAWMGLFMLLWASATGFSLLGPKIVLWLRGKLVGIATLTTWLGGSLGGLLAGWSSKSSGGKDDQAPALSPAELLAVAGPYIFVFGLLLVLSALADKILMNFASPLAVALIYVTTFAVCAFFAWRVDINEFSLHAFYRNRLTRCYLGASRTKRDPNPFTGFDDNDADIAVRDLSPERDYKGPFPIFCTALNLTFGKELAWQERKAASFIFTPLYSGYDIPWTAARGKTKLRFNGFVRTEHYAYPETGVHINTAAAISGAALSPNMGYHSNAATAFLMTVFCVRLGWWLSNPRTLDENGTKLGCSYHPSPSPVFSLMALAGELFGRTDDTNAYVYLSDGGHFDNMGLYELVRRHCRYIVICDSEADGDIKFSGIGMAIRKCRIDFGAEIDLDLRPLERAKNSEYSPAHCVVGSVRYPENPDNPGTVVYIKSSLTGDEPADVLNYKKEHSCFPHDSTTNQWFTESQFESYRRLGHHVAFSVFEPAGPNPVVDCGEKRQRRVCVCTGVEDRKEFFDDLHCTWWAATPEMERFTAAHTDRYEALLSKARTDGKLPGFYNMMVGGEGSWKKDHSEEQIEYAVEFSSELIEFIWMVYNQLNMVLPERRDHSYSKGWSRIFKQWAKIDVVQEAWKRFRRSYSSSFRRYAESECVKMPRQE
jgi:hypothetical protein